MLVRLASLSLRLLMLLVMAAAAVYALDPAGARRRVADALLSAFRAGGEHVIDRDLADLEAQLASARQRVEQGKALRETLAGKLRELGARRRAIAGRAAENRAVLREIHAVLSSHAGEAVPVNGVTYARAVVERDADRFLRQALQDQEEARQVEKDERALASADEQACRFITSAEEVLRGRGAELASMRTRVDVQRLREQLAALDADPWGVRAERANALVQPLAGEMTDEAPTPKPSDVTDRLSAYLAAADVR